ncbi:unnamed protein product [Chironomus riparius]|uniref:Uncharacterized protein n=1 Tax=Chironomus riparius TaxID=315576 RepID=A0A9N9X1F9_9DIPT|nr:unnamed protein product [Chironomus riparius]
MTKNLETQCCKCGGAATKNNKLIGCDFMTCLKVFHDNCNDNPVRIDGNNKFVCDEHRARVEQDQQKNAGNSVQEVDLTSVEPLKNSEQNPNLQEKAVNPKLKDDNQFLEQQPATTSKEATKPNKTKEKDDEECNFQRSLSGVPAQYPLQDIPKTITINQYHFDLLFATNWEGFNHFNTFVPNNLNYKHYDNLIDKDKEKRINN